MTDAEYDNAPCGFLTTQPDGVIVEVNRAFLELSGYARDELVGVRRFADLLTVGGQIYHETHYAPMIQLRGSAREIALDIVRADGARQPVLVNSVLERDGAGVPTVVRTAVFEATERREYERELLRAKQRAEESEARAAALARTLQQTLIPPEPAQVPGLDVAAAYRPAGNGEEVGGDFYDVFEVQTDDWVVLVGDVCGKGVEAAVITALARYTLRAAAVRARRPSHALQTLNEVLLGHATDRFCTATVVRLQRSAEQWSATVSAAGHPLPLLVRPDGTHTDVGRPGALLGVFPGPAVHDVEVPLAAGEALVLYTDGVTEGRRGVEMYGEARLAAAAHAGGGTAQGITDSILADVLAYQSDDARDDIAIVCLRVPSARTT